MSLILFIGCKEEKDSRYLITKDSVGKLKRTDLVKDIAHIYEQDSVVQDTSALNIGTSTKKINIYEKGGKHLLTITPTSDSIPKIENLRIYDPRFVSDKGIGLNSTFKEIKDNYTIRKIVTSRNNVVLFVKDSDMYFTISREELPASLRYATNTSIEAVQIPDNARIKYLMVGW